MKIEEPTFQPSFPAMPREDQGCCLPVNFNPVCPTHFSVNKIILAKGSLDTLERKRFIHRICGLFPVAEISKQLNTPHNRVDLGETNPHRIHLFGKKTLVFGVLGNSVRFSQEEGNTCPSYWHFSPTSFCFFDCSYCYLAGTPGVWFSPTIRIFVNVEQILHRIDQIAIQQKALTSFYLGKLQDGLSLDPLTAYSTVLIPFFAKHPFARQILLTKSNEVDRLLGLEHNGHTILSWSLNPPEISARFEKEIPTVDQRISAMKRCYEAGYPIRANLMPLIPVHGWQEIYERFLRRFLNEVPLKRLTIGGICSYKNAKRMMDRKLGRKNPISCSLEEASSVADGRIRYPQELRLKMYSHILNVAAKEQPRMETALCMEQRGVWNALDMEGRIGRCNCVL